ncbi:MAG TPA: VIT domain-containing protein [Niabella sp.]
MKLICRLILTPLLLFAAATIAAQTPVMEVHENGQYKTDQTIVLQQLSADVKIVGAIATTTMRISFYNQSSRIKEGRLTFPLPEGVSVSGFALDMNGYMRKAVPVEKEKAAAVFESVERRKVDPGLLEKTEGNNFRTRVYPLNPNGIRTVEIVYNQQLFSNKGQLIYHLPLADEMIKTFTLTATVYDKVSVPQLTEKPDGSFVFEKKGNAWKASVTKSGFTPNGSLTIALPQSEGAPEALVKKNEEGGYYFLANVPVTAPTPVRKTINRITILWDNSLSGKKRDHRKEEAFLQQLLATKNNIDVSLYAVATTTRKVGDYTISNGAIGQVLKAIEDLIYDGATDYSTIPDDIARNGDVLFFTDGLSNFGEWSRLPGTAVHTLIATPVADYSKLQLISNATGGQMIDLNRLGIAEAADRITTSPYRFLGIKYLYDVTDVYPATPVAVNGNLLVTGIVQKLPATVTLQFGYGNKVEKEIPILLNTDVTAADWNIETFWAQQKIAALEVFYEQNKETIARLGKKMGIATKNTSLLVLENAADYAKYEITPPADLMQEYSLLIKQRKEEREAAWGNYLTAAKEQIRELKEWWNTDFSKRPKKRIWTGAPDAVSSQPMPSAIAEDKEVAAVSDSNNGYLADQKIGNGAPGQANMLQARVSGLAVRNQEPEEEVVTAAPPRGKVRTIDIQSDAAYMKQFSTTVTTADAYKTYLRLREKYQTTPSFYFDVANWFYEHKEPVRAITILSNLVELELEDATLYKTVAYLLKKYGDEQKELLITKKVLNWRPMDPQSYRDYALALQDNGNYQQALDTLYTALTHMYTEESRNRDNGIEEVLLMEMNHIVSLHNAQVSTANIDKTLLYGLPVDIRVVLNWNLDNTDMDLHVIDPLHEECYYQNRETAIGGRLSDDFTDGFGPEQFLLKKAVKGKYQIKTNFFGERSVTAVGPPTLMAEVFLRYATGAEERKIVVFQDAKGSNANSSDGQTLIAEFEF